jgi:hypothetical protein
MQEDDKLESSLAVAIEDDLDIAQKFAPRDARPSGFGSERQYAKMAAPPPAGRKTAVEDLEETRKLTADVRRLLKELHGHIVGGAAGDERERSIPRPSNGPPMPTMMSIRHLSQEIREDAQEMMRVIAAIRQGL